MSKVRSAKLAFVVAARNDNYGGDFLHRMQVFVDVLLALCNKHLLNSELVVVEWNPPPVNRPLAEALSWPQHSGCVDVRFILVPPEVHQNLPNSDRMPMFEYIAKNVGIRWATGQFIVSTNPDLVYSDALIRYLAEEPLSEDKFYRVDRYDVHPAVPLNLTVEERLEFCANHIVRTNDFWGSHAVGAEPEPEPNTRAGKRRVGLLRLLDSLLPNKVDDYVHTNASGDFFLMARRHWHSLRGYPELSTHSYIDGYICYMAASAGLQQAILPDPFRLYHQEHDRAEHRERPLTDYQLYRKRALQMLRTKRPLLLNESEAWGLGEHQLEEKQINGQLTCH